MSGAITVENVPSLLHKIAGLRSEGKPWPEIAQLLKMTVEKVRQLVWDNEATYRKLLKRASRFLLEDCVIDAMRALQEQLKSANEKIRHSASNCLTRIWMAQLRLKPRPKATKTPPPAPAVPVAVPAHKPAIPPTLKEPQKEPSTPATPPSVPTISSDQVLKWLNEKKIGV